MAGRYEYHEFYVEPIGGKSDYLNLRQDDPVKQAIMNNQPFKMKKDHKDYKFCKQVWDSGGKLQIHICVNNPEAFTFKEELKYRIYWLPECFFGKPVEKDLLTSDQKDERLQAQLRYEATLPEDQRPKGKPVHTDPNKPPPGWL